MPGAWILHPLALWQHGQENSRSNFVLARRIRVYRGNFLQERLSLYLEKEKHSFFCSYLNFVNFDPALLHPVPFHTKLHQTIWLAPGSRAVLAERLNQRVDVVMWQAKPP